MSQIKQICLFVLLAITTCGAQVATHKDASKTFEERASFLVSQMTLKEKVSQMTYNSAAIDRWKFQK